MRQRVVHSLALLQSFRTPHFRVVKQSDILVFYSSIVASYLIADNCFVQAMVDL